MTDVGIDTAAPPTTVTAPEGSPERVGVSEAARLLRSARRPPKEESKPVVAEAPAPAPEQESSPAEDAAPPTEATGETQEADPVERPQIEPPRSWSKEARERWSNLDPDTQNYLLERDRDDTAAVRKAQNEAAEQRKAIEAERSKVEQARQQFETALPQVLALLNHQATTEFADIQSDADVDRLVREDWPRYIQWQRHREKTVTVLQQMQAAQQQKHTEEQRKFADFAKEQGEKFLEKVPDMRDPDKAKALQAAAMSTLTSAGFEENELAQAWQGQTNVPFRDHRVQLMIHKAALWDQAQAKAKTVVEKAKPLPPVQRPGAAQPKGAAQAAQIETLGKKIDGARNYTEGAKLGAQLLRARRAAR